MRQLRTLVIASQTLAEFVPKGGREFPHHYQRNSAVTNDRSVSLRVTSEASAKEIHGNLPFKGLGSRWNEIQAPGAQLRLTETIVHFVGNDPARTKALTEFLVSKGMSVAIFKTAAEYTPGARDDRPACLILDLTLPDADGLELQSRLAGSGAPPVIFITAQGDPVSVVRAMKNGAIDFMLEPVDFGQLMAAVELAFAEDLKKRNERIECTALLTRWQSLTPRETEVFHHTVAGLLNKQAAAELGVAENTYQVHRGRVMRKMQANSLADLVRMSTKLESILPKPCRKRTCYGVTVAVPTRINKSEHHSESNPSTYGERSVEARGYAAGLGGL